MTVTHLFPQQWQGWGKGLAGSGAADAEQSTENQLHPPAKEHQWVTKDAERMAGRSVAHQFSLPTLLTSSENDQGAHWKKV